MDKLVLAMESTDPRINISENGLDGKFPTKLRKLDSQIIPSDLIRSDGFAEMRFCEIGRPIDYHNIKVESDLVRSTNGSISGHLPYLKPSSLMFSPIPLPISSYLPQSQHISEYLQSQAMPTLRQQLVYIQRQSSNLNEYNNSILNSHFNLEGLGPYNLSAYPIPKQNDAQNPFSNDNYLKYFPNNIFLDNLNDFKMGNHTSTLRKRKANQKYDDIMTTVHGKACFVWDKSENGNNVDDTGCPKSGRTSSSESEHGTVRSSEEEKSEHIQPITKDCSYFNIIMQILVSNPDGHDLLSNKVLPAYKDAKDSRQRCFLCIGDEGCRTILFCVQCTYKYSYPDFVYIGPTCILLDTPNRRIHDTVQSKEAFDRFKACISCEKEQFKLKTKEEKEDYKIKIKREKEAKKKLDNCVKFAQSSESNSPVL